MRQIKEIISHCSFTPPSMDIGADEIRVWHVEENGWEDNGYNYVIRRNGILELGRDLDGDGNVDEEVGAHARGFNKHSIGICLIGGMDEHGNPDCNFTFRQYATLYSLGQQLKSKYPHAKFIGHRDVSDKSCPTFDAKQFFAGF